MAFHDVRFPVEISLGSEGGPMRRTEIVTLASGHEERNTPWAGSRRRFNAGYGATTMQAIEGVIAFYEARRGQLHSFRWRDAFDWKSCPVADEPQSNDQVVGSGDGIGSEFQLIKTYESGADAWSRAITKPVAGSVLVAIDGVLQAEGTDYAVDTLTGLVIFTAPPGADTAITAGYEFDVPVRFDTDELTLSFAAVKAGRIPDLPVIEVLG